MSCYLFIIFSFNEHLHNGVGKLSLESFVTSLDVPNLFNGPHKFLENSQSETARNINLRNTVMRR